MVLHVHKEHTHTGAVTRNIVATIELRSYKNRASTGKIYFTLNCNVYAQTVRRGICIHSAIPYWNACLFTMRNHTHAKVIGKLVMTIYLGDDI